MSPVTTPSSSTTAAQPVAGEWRPDTLRELREQLIWPGLLRTPSLALAPTRLGVAFFTLLLLALLWELPTLWIDGPGPIRLAGEHVAAALRLFAHGLGLMPAGPAEVPHPFLTATAELFYHAPAAMFTSYPLTSVLLLPPTIIIWCIGVATISRSAACEFAQAFLLPWPQALAFALSRAASLIAAMAAPLLLIAFVALVLAGGGAVLLTWPVGDLIAAVLSPLALLMATVAVFGLAGYLLGQQLIIPAVVCEGTDSIDAVQRTYAYVVGRPALLLLYVLIAAVVAAFALAIAGILAGGITGFATAAAGHWSGARGEQILSNAPGLTGTAWLAAGLIRIALAIPAGIVAAYAFSLYASGSTVLYLLLRQANDGQEPGELWMPGMIDGTMAQSPAMAAARAGDEDADES